MTTTSADRRRGFGIALALTGLSLMLGACNTAGDITQTVPTDYRQRHPIAVQEGRKSIVIFVGTARGGLSAAQHSDVAGIARDWMREGTGSVVVDVPVDSANSRAAAATYREIRSVLTSGGVPARAIVQHPYRPEDPGLLPTIRLSYSKITAVAGPCGLWPEDIGPSILDPGYNENRPYFNLGCASQRNLAAMIDNPADLEQPRSETPAYTARRDIAFERYRKGTAVATPNPDADKAKLSDTGK
ncbi:pilus assembly protein CpaD [Bradyrhizobium sp. WBOS7]|uniref:Pilus assembly protein CpaD n=1 Tax=Bradyrhizobium betae TaxID=244734 RepID=A0AAE9SNN5_9BRAD|nr:MULTISPECIES: CpaD family pilus assembly protein [Bradyrhizobium]MDD1573176.1 pilus assembly protein CpaD [Bradyrhizobium sp. WBOS1]UUO33900.1 pilus assembly protein CpaD [Bradyrhizobium sp. WBOS01]MDD1528455.1 pilus assembly protein CpaD [Bradyrhizobium sp. WBOS2]MDD1577223.1 pilus assembly protein CpaD [Bradyrhizobium sp. WBOS7]MDD1600270.1 pilus assembly protein CpaD [Bradyrhizobium sp. WBOS16]